jgi:hypothetical protein
VHRSHRSTLLIRNSWFCVITLSFAHHVFGISLDLMAKVLFALPKMLSLVRQNRSMVGSLRRPLFGSVVGESIK